MHGTPVTGQPVPSPVLLIGQAPGHKEVEVHRPFAWTAGKTLFKWFDEIGMEEQDFRQRVYMSAVCRCFPGKNPKGGDRVPDTKEIDNCSEWLDAEIKMLAPQLILPVGKLAIGRLLEFKKLTEVVGKQSAMKINGKHCDVIPLPHPSGASTWHRTQPGKSLLQQSLQLIAEHRAWQSLLDD
jgi:uracil-DNA glycosylase